MSNDRIKFEQVRGEVLALTGCVISIYGALSSIRYALPASTDKELIKNVEEEIAELSERLDSLMALFKNSRS